MSETPMSNGRTVRDGQEARKIATLWAYCHGAPVYSCTRLADEWFNESLNVGKRTWNNLESYLRQHSGSAPTQHETR